MDSTEQVIAFRAKVDAHDSLLRLLVFWCQLRDPQFAKLIRDSLDQGLGRLIAENDPSELDPTRLAIREKMRMIIREILEFAENEAAMARNALAKARSRGRCSRKIK